MPVDVVQPRVALEAQLRPARCEPGELPSCGVAVALAAELRRVHLDEPDAAAVLEQDRVAVAGRIDRDGAGRGRRAAAGWRRGGLRGGRPGSGGGDPDECRLDHAHVRRLEPDRHRLDCVRLLRPLLVDLRHLVEDLLLQLLEVGLGELDLLLGALLALARASSSRAGSPRRRVPGPHARSCACLPCRRAGRRRRFRGRRGARCCGGRFARSTPPRPCDGPSRGRARAGRAWSRDDRGSSPSRVRGGFRRLVGAGSELLLRLARARVEVELGVAEQLERLRVGEAPLDLAGGVAEEGGLSSSTLGST